MIDKIEGNKRDIIIGIICMAVFGVGFIILGIVLFLKNKEPIVLWMFGGIAILSFVYVIYSFRRINTYKIELFPTYFIIYNGKKEIKIEKDALEDFKIVQRVVHSGGLRVRIATLDIKYRGVEYSLDPNKYKDVFFKMCRYYGITEKDALAYGK